MRRLFDSISGMRLGTIVAITALLGSVTYFGVMAFNSYCATTEQEPSHVSDPPMQDVRPRIEVGIKFYLYFPRTGVELTIAQIE